MPTLRSALSLGLSLPALTAQSDTEAATRLLARQARPIALQAEVLGDLSFLDKALKGRRLVLLGESNHGSAEFARLHLRLIRYLHEKLGFNVLLLESGLGEVEAIQRQRERLDAGKLLQLGLIGPWRDEDHEAWLRYLKQHPELQVAGIDVQRSGSGFARLLRQTVRGAADELPATVAIETGVEARFGKLAARLRARDEKPSEELTKAINALTSDIAGLIRFLEVDAETGKDGPDRKDLLICGKALRNRIEYLTYFSQFKADGNWRARFAARDWAMARNLQFWREHIYPREKMIVIAHNFHIARHNPKESVMGELLAKEFGKEMFSVAMFAGAGRYADNSRRPKPLDLDQEPHDIQRLIRGLRHPASFFVLPSDETPDSAWLARPVQVRHSFLDLDGGTALVLRGSYDALLMVGKVTPSRY